jgi:hypothetical protein
MISAALAADEEEWAAGPATWARRANLANPAAISWSSVGEGRLPA